MRLFLLFGVLSCAFAMNVLISDKVATREDVANAGWRISPASGLAQVTVSFAFKINRDLLEETINAVSFPNSPRYGQHLSQKELTELISPPSSLIEAVVRFIQSYGVQEYELKSNNGYLYITISGALASQMFSTELFTLRHESGRTVLFHSFSGLYVPPEVAAVITLVNGISTTVPTVKAARIQVNQIDALGETTVPDLKKIYGIDANYNATNPQACTQALGEFQYQWFSPSDLQVFFTAYSPNNVGRTVAKVVGNNNANFPGVEANLDVQYMMSMGSNCATSFYYINDGSFIQSLLDFFVDLNNEANPEKVVSVSFGTNGNEPFSTVDQLDQECAKLGTRGVTVMFASGDNGVGCLNGANEPDFPNSPHILMVGATDYGTGTEIGAKLSSGGFSNDYPIQSWQSTFVSNFFKTASASGSLPPANQYNASGRGFPDVSAVGVNLPVIVNGKKQDASGTSFSSPIFGGILSLLNDLRVKAGKSTLGWVNPLFYQIATDNPSAFFDITTGPRNSDGTCVGFLPQAGWDPVTGLGTPNFQVLAKIINNY